MALLAASGAVRSPAANAKPPGIVNVLKGKDGQRDVLTTTTGIKYAVDLQGSGDAPKPGDLVLVEVKGMLEDGTVFLDTKQLGSPLAFELGTSNKYITEGLGQVVERMRGGGRVLAVVPPALGYAAKATALQQGRVPANADLYYEVELLRCQTFTLGLACCSDADYPCIKKTAPPPGSEAGAEAAPAAATSK